MELVSNKENGSITILWVLVRTRFRHENVPGSCSAFTHQLPMFSLRLESWRKGCRDTRGMGGWKSSRIHKNGRRPRVHQPARYYNRYGTYFLAVATELLTQGKGWPRVSRTSDNEIRGSGVMEGKC